MTEEKVDACSCRTDMTTMKASNVWRRVMALRKSNLRLRFVLGAVVLLVVFSLKTPKLETMVSPPTRIQKSLDKSDSTDKQSDLVDHHPAMSKLMERRAAYGADIDRWKLRGLGYMYDSLNMVLFGKRHDNKIIFQNLLGPTKDCEKLTLWVRVNGPEIFAGKATAVSTNNESCHWEFEFNLHVPGEYEIDSKVLLWNGDAEIVEHKRQKGSLAGLQCDAIPGGPSNVTFSEYNDHVGVHGFKMYNPVHMCCESCSRQPHCVYWATPPDFFNSTWDHNGCEFYYDKEHQHPISKWLPKRSDARRRLGERAPFHGPPHTHPTAYFLGCGWSYWFTLDVPCLSGELDDKIHVENPMFSHSSETSATLASPELPLCEIDNEALGSKGRWVRLNDPGTCPKQQADKDFSTKFLITEFDGDRPECWHRDDLSKVGGRCMEMNCALIPKSSRWLSNLHNETNWYGIWRNNDCDYLEFTDAQLQQCITERGISTIKTSGMSIAKFLNEFLQQRLKGINMTESGTTVILSTLGLSHKAGTPNADVREDIASEIPPTGPSEEIYYMSGYFVSSERAVHLHLARMEYLNSLVTDILKDTGHKLLNAFDLSAAFTYDSATQMDGMHIIGPPMKMILSKLFHHMCKDTTEGRRMG